jgi:hypothetical protein
MSVWQLATWVAVLCLIVGSIAVFAWFLRDALALLRRRDRGPRGEVR